MSQEQDKKLYDTLTRTGELLKSVTPVEGAEYSLDAILAEFGQSGAKPAQKVPETEKETADFPSAAPTEAFRDKAAELSEKKPIPGARLEKAGRRMAPAEKKEKPVKTEKEELFVDALPREALCTAASEPPEHIEPTGEPIEEPQETPLLSEEDPTPPDRVSLKSLMADTVDAVLAENDDGILAPHTPFSRRLRDVIPSRHAQRYTHSDTEELWSDAEPEPEEEQEPEPLPEDAYRAGKRTARHLNRGTTLLLIPAVLSVGITGVEAFALLPPLWTENAVLHGGVLGGLLLLSLLMGMDIWRAAIAHVREKKGSCELAALLVALVNLGYCVYGIFFGFAAGEPFVAAACVGLWLCQQGLYLEAESRHTAYALVNMGGTPPYTVSATEVGACKQKGTLEGFYRASEKPDLSRMVQWYAAPMLVAVATILSGVVCITGDTMERFLWVWSAMLTAAVPLSLPLTGTLPLYCLQKRLRTGGSAIAGWWGAKGIRAKRRLVLTEKDIFPPGTVEFNGYKVFGEERRKMIAYAAAVTHEAHSQLAELFAQQLAAEGGFRYTAEELQFCEEGGISCTIRGESVLMGSAYFMRQRQVTLPHDLKLQTGVFLAVDGVLGAIFVIKYQPSRNVEWALRAMMRAKIRPILAVRSGNVTPGLLKRKFRLDARPVYPDVVTRLALSDTMENVGECANAVLYREGLMPLAETVIGTMRMRRVSRMSLVLSYLSAAAGIFLCYYFTNQGTFGALSPLYMLGFLILWLVPTVVLADSVKHF